MMLHEPLAFNALRGTLRRDAPLARHTSWRVGGKADALFVPADRDDLAAFVAQWPREAPLTVQRERAQPRPPGRHIDPCADSTERQQDLGGQGRALLA